MGSTGRPVRVRAKPRARHPGSRARVTVIAGVGLAAVAGLLYLGARETSVFAVRDVVVVSSSEEVARAVEEALAPAVGDSLVAVSVGDLEHVARSVPAVRAAEVERDFPGTLRVSVSLERPVAVVRQAGDAWLVAASARVLRMAEVGELPSFPRVWLTRGGAAIVPGAVLDEEHGALAIRALAAVPSPFPGPVHSAGGSRDELTLVVGARTELRLGEAVDLRVKLEIAAAVLRSLSRGERDALAYLDVSLPTRPVGGGKPQFDS
jgi:cell division septal protein FtsQ